MRFFFNNTPKNTTPDNYSARAELKEFFDKNNVNAQTRHDDSDGSDDYTFDYQNGHFTAVIYKSDRYVTVSYPVFKSMGIEHLDLVRHACNHFNTNTSVFGFVYTINEECNMVNLHINFSCDRPSTSEFVNRLSGCFYFQRTVSDYLDNKVKEGDKDSELTAINRQRRTYLLSQQELAHQPGNEPDYHVYSGYHPFTLSHMVKTCLGLDSLHIERLVLSAEDDVTVVIGDENIAEMDIITPMVDDEMTQFAMDQATAMLTYVTPDDPDTRKTISIALTTAGSDDSSFYVRVTMTVVPEALSAKKPLLSRQQVQCASMLVAIDRQDPANKMEEFRYMWEDALIKMKNNEELSRDQRMLAESYWDDTAYNSYWGTKLFHQGRYYEAIVHLERVFRTLSGQFYDKKKVDSFHDVCYYLGFSYCELRNYEKAFYYLDILSQSNRIDYVKEYINAMTNSRDVRTLGYIAQTQESLRATVDDLRERGEDEPQHLIDFMEFLERRRGYAFIEYGFLDEAEKIFKALLESPNSHDYAVNELAHIQRLRRQDGNDSDSEK